MRLGRDGLREPDLDLVLAAFGDAVALAVRARPGLSLPSDGLPVPRQAGEGGVHLTVGKRPTAAEEGVVVALQVVAVARFAIEEPEEGHGDAHTCEHTLGVYTEQLDIGRLWIEGCPCLLYTSDAADEEDS